MVKKPRTSDDEFNPVSFSKKSRKREYEDWAKFTEPDTPEQDPYASVEPKEVIRMRGQKHLAPQGEERFSGAGKLGHPTRKGGAEATLSKMNPLGERPEKGDWNGIWVNIPGEGGADDLVKKWRSDSGSLYDTKKYPEKYPWDKTEKPLALLGDEPGNFLSITPDNAQGVRSQVIKCSVCQRPQWRDQFGVKGDKDYKRQKATCNECSERGIIKGVEGKPGDFQWNFPRIGDMLEMGLTDDSPAKEATNKHVKRFLVRIFG